MSSSPKVVGRLSSRRFTLAVGAGLVFGVLFAAAADGPQNLTPEQVKDLQAKYTKERADADKDGLTKQFSPEWYARADVFAKKAEAALTAGRLGEARELFVRARWQLPAPPPGLPAHVSRIFGDGKLRHSGKFPSNYWILALAYSPDGSKLASAGIDGTIKIWDTQTGRELRCIVTAGEPRSIAFSPDGKDLAAGSSDATVKLWEVDTGKEVRSFAGNTETVYGVAFSPDGKMIVSGGGDKNVRVWEVESGKPKYTLIGSSMITAVAWSPDGKYFASTSGSGIASVWNASNGTIQWSSQVSKLTLGAVVFTTDSKRIVVGGAENIIWFLDADQPTERDKFTGHSDPINCLAVSKDGKTLVSGGKDKTVRLWDLVTPTRQPFRTFQGSPEEVKAVALSPDGTTLASCGMDNLIRMWDLGNAEQSRELSGHEGSVWSAIFSPDGKHVVSGSADNTLKVWDVETGKVVHTLKGHTSAVTAAVYSPDGKYILSCGGDKVLKLWDAEKGGDALRTFTGHTGVVTAVAFDKDGKRIVSGGADHLVKVWDVEGKELNSFAGHRGVVMAVAFAPDGKSVASGSADQTIKLWKLADGSDRTLNGHGGAVSCLDFSPDGKRLVSGGSDNQVKVWELNGDDVKAVTLTPSHTGPVSSVAWSKNGRFLASAGADQIIKLWDAQNRQPEEKNTYRGHKNWVSSVAFSPDGTYLASASIDKTVRLWELVSREAMPGYGHTRYIKAVAVSPDGKLVASGAKDNTVRVWESATGKELFTLVGHTDEISAMAFAPDSKTLVSVGGGDDRTIRIWDAALGKEVRTIRDPGPNNDVPAMMVSPDGKKIIVWVASSNPIEIYDLATGKQDSSRPATEGKITCLTFSADGTLAAMGDSNGAIRVVTVADMKPIEGGEFTAYKGPNAEELEISDLLLTPDKKTLITFCTRKGELKIWDLTKQAKAKAKAPDAEKTIPMAKGGLLPASAISADGKTFATADVDNVVKVLDLTGKEVRSWDFSKMAGADRPLVRSLAFTPDGKGLVTGNGNTTLYLLEVQ